MPTMSFNISKTTNKCQHQQELLLRLYWIFYKQYTIQMKLLLAPMATLSTQALRTTISEFGGCDEYYCEMIQAASLVCGGKFEHYYITDGPEPEKMVWQLTDSKVDSIIQATKIVSDIGGIGVDINMGCPAPEIYRQGAGVAWMSKPLSETALMLEKVKSVLDNNNSTTCKRLSVKIRLGEEDFTMEKFFSFVDMLTQSGVTQIVLHPRTRKEKYARKARWEFINQLYEHIQETGNSQISIIGNGSISSIEEAKSSLLKAPNVNGIMLGRYAVQKPWLFKIISETFNHPELCGKRQLKIDLLDVAINQMKYIREFQPQEFWKTRTQRFFIYYCDNFQFGNYLKTQMINNEGHEIQEKILRDYFAKMNDEQFYSITY